MILFRQSGTREGKTLFLCTGIYVLRSIIRVRVYLTLLILVYDKQLRCCIQPREITWPRQNPRHEYIAPHGLVLCGIYQVRAFLRVIYALNTLYQTTLCTASKLEVSRVPRANNRRRVQHRYSPYILLLTLGYVPGGCFLCQDKVVLLLRAIRKHPISYCCTW